MSSPERSPKRQRTSYSPASPPLQEQEQKSFAVAQTLHTPPPSVHMSPSWQSQNMANGVTSDVSPQTNATSQVTTKMGEESSRTQESSVENTQAENNDVEMADADHRRTDHERITETDVEDSSLNAPSLYKFSANPLNPLQPDPATDLIQRYSLQTLQASVARRDPKTGEKINKLRKSYETKSKNLGIEGRTKATVQEGHLQGLVDPLWDSLISDGVTMWDEKNQSTTINSSSADEMMNTLQSALQFKSGNLPKAEHNEWTQQLGLDEVPAARPALPNALPASKSTNNLFLAKTAPLAAARASAPSSPNTIMNGRPDRAGKKRRYDESSYEGYDDDGYSTGGLDENRRNAAKRVKRKDMPNSTSPPFSTHGGNNAIGVRGS